MKGNYSMPNLTDFIEEYLKKLFTLSTKNYIEIQRRDLASKFSCVPSQINYVLERRFTLESGYLVEGKRGGGGFIRIYRIEPGHLNTWQEIIDNLDDANFDPIRVRRLIRRMYEDKLLSLREVRILEVITGESVYDSCHIYNPQVRKLQCRLFSKILEELLKHKY